jgi:hypothetical protein
MELKDKLEILADAAKYDASCASSGAPKRDSVDKDGLGATTGMGICHSYTPDGRCVSLLKILLTNFCVYDCQYCVNRRTSNVPRARFSVDEVVKLTQDFYLRNYIDGLFLSSGIIQSSDYTMEQLVEVARRLREVHKFRGYIHLKTIPDADPRLIELAGKYADRLSVNIELPTQDSVTRLAPEKNVHTIKLAMGSIRTKLDEKDDHPKAPVFAPAGQSTQMIVGADASDDQTILNTAQTLYGSYKLKRVYYSAFSPIPQSPDQRALRAAAAAARTPPVPGRFPTARLWLHGRRTDADGRQPGARHRSQAGLGFSQPRALSARPEPRRRDHDRARAGHRPAFRKAHHRFAPAAPYPLGRSVAPALQPEKAGALRRHGRLQAGPGRGILGAAAAEHGRCAAADEPLAGIAGGMMRPIQQVLAGQPLLVDSFAGWREAARELLAYDVAPDRVTWSSPQMGGDLFSSAPPPAQDDAAAVPPMPERAPRKPAPHIPRALMDMLQSAACCRDPDRWAFLYRVIWRWQLGEHDVQSPADEDGARLNAMVKAVRREEHDMHAYIRFRERPEQPDRRASSPGTNRATTCCRRWPSISSSAWARSAG